MESFARRTSRDFAFVVKAYKGMTHSVDNNIRETCRFFKEGIEPLGANLKALLFQFPVHVPADRREYRLYPETER